MQWQRFILLFACMVARLDASDFDGCHYDLSMRGFVDELVFIQGTSRTPLFDDYTPGSYHVDKIELLRALAERANDDKVMGCSLWGPIGPLWEYQLFVFLADPDGTVRLNYLLFPHARIVYKATRVMARQDFDAWRGALAADPRPLRALPLSAQVTGCELDEDEVYGVIAFFSPSTDVYRTMFSVYSRDTDPTVDVLDSYVAQIYGGLITTYSTDLGDKAPIAWCD